MGEWVLSACGLPRPPSWCNAELWVVYLVSCMCCHTWSGKLGTCGWLTPMSRHVIPMWSLRRDGFCATSCVKESRVPAGCPCMQQDALSMLLFHSCIHSRTCPTGLCVTHAACCHFCAVCHVDECHCAVSCVDVLCGYVDACSWRSILGHDPSCRRTLRSGREVHRYSGDIWSHIPQGAFWPICNGADLLWDLPP